LDGPSAGVAFVVGVVADRPPVRTDVARRRISLRGLALPIGGVEKMAAARRYSHRDVACELA
jgi:ATP-dependent Lon protease